MISPASAEQVGEIGVDWAGNDIVVEAIEDPEVTGVTCHLAYFERGLIDRLANGNWFEDPPTAPSNASKPAQSFSATSSAPKMAKTCFAPAARSSSRPCV